MLDSRIRSLDGYFYSVCGKLVCFTSDVLDLNDPEVVSDLISFADGLYTDKSTIRMSYGRESVCSLRLVSGDEVMIEVYPLSVLPEGSQALARKELGLDE